MPDVATGVLRPFFTFYGGKWRAAPRYPAPQHGTIVEPFAGAAGYSLRYADRDIVLVEKDPVIAGVWQYLIRTSAAEIMALPLLGEGQSVDDLCVCQEARWLIGFHLNKGNCHPCKTPSAWMRSGIRPNSFWGAAMRLRVASQVDSIRHWLLIEGDYTDSWRVEATWFVDPPYDKAGKYYACSSRDIDYAALGAWCRTRPGQVIACEQDGATWLPFRPFMAIKSNESLHGKHVSHEAIWISDGMPP